MQEVAALCDEIVIIAEGQVALHDSPDGIRTVSGFIGEPVAAGQSNRSWNRGSENTGATE